MASNIKRVKFACYAGNITQATTGNIPPLLFLTFHTLYGISYSLLGLLVLIFFFSQLGIDLVFSLFSHKFNIRKTVCLMPVLAILGLAIYALFPLFLPQYAYLGLVIGTVIFAVSSGLAEVLISPIIAALPSDNPEREMSKLHSIYAWGVVGFSKVKVGIGWSCFARRSPSLALFCFSRASCPLWKPRKKFPALSNI